MDSQPSGLDAAFADLNRLIAEDQGISTPEPQQEDVVEAVSETEDAATSEVEDDAESFDTEADQTAAAPDTAPVPESGESSSQAAADAAPPLPPEIQQELEESRRFRASMEQALRQAAQVREQQEAEQQRQQAEAQQRQVMAERLAWMRDNIPEDRQAEYVAQLNNEIFARPVMQQAQQRLQQTESMLEDTGATATAVYIAAQKFLSEPERLVGLTPEQRTKAFKDYVGHLRQHGTSPQAMSSQVEFENSIRADERQRVMAEMQQASNKKAAARKNTRVASGVDAVPSTTGAPAGNRAQSDLDRVLAGVFGD